MICMVRVVAACSALSLAMTLGGCGSGSAKQAATACSVVPVHAVRAATGFPQFEQTSPSLSPPTGGGGSVCFFLIPPGLAGPKVSARFVARGGAGIFTAFASHVPGAPPNVPVGGIGAPAIWVSNESGQLLVLKGDRRIELEVDGFSDDRSVAVDLARRVLPNL
jgi:hypothetical protein